MNCWATFYIGVGWQQNQVPVLQGQQHPGERPRQEPTLDSEFSVVPVVCSLTLALETSVASPRRPQMVGPAWAGTVASNALNAAESRLGYLTKCCSRFRETKGTKCREETSPGTKAACSLAGAQAPPHPRALSLAPGSIRGRGHLSPPLLSWGIALHWALKDSFLRQQVSRTRGKTGAAAGFSASSGCSPGRGAFFPAEAQGQGPSMSARSLLLYLVASFKKNIFFLY